jgi:hypothetical protein
MALRRLFINIVLRMIDGRIGGRRVDDPMIAMTPLRRRCPFALLLVMSALRE